MSNLLTYIPSIMNVLDAHLIQQSTSGWMQANAGQVKYLGGKEIKVPRLLMTGLGDYDRVGGKYPKGSIQTEYQLLEMSQDRASEFYFDRNDVDETGYVAEASSVMSQFQTEFVIPEIDAYRYSKISQLAANAGQSRTYTADKDTVLSTLLEDLKNIQDNTDISLDQLVITMPYTVLFALELSAELTKGLSVNTFSQGGLDLQMKTLNGATIIPVSSGRMKTAYTFSDGATDFGFAPTASAKDINWIITPLSTPIAVSKTDSLKIFSPDVNQDGDGWKTQYRVYHDLFILENKLNGVFCNIAI